MPPSRPSPRILSATNFLPSPNTRFTIFPNSPSPSRPKAAASTACSTTRTSSHRISTATSTPSPRTSAPSWNALSLATITEKALLYLVIKRFAAIDLSPAAVDNVQMGYVFEELIRIGAEQSNEEAGEHFTPREVIKLMVNLLLSPEKDLARSHVVKTIYDPACGTGGMLSVSEKYIRDLNAQARPLLFGQDWNDEGWAVCESDMLIKGEDADTMRRADTFTRDGYARDLDNQKLTFDYMLANPPFGVERKQQQRYIEQERDSLGYDGRFGAGTPRVNDGALLFLQHMLAKMRVPKAGGSRVSIVFNGSPLVPR